MKNNYSGGSPFGRLFSTLGFLTAIVLLIGALSKAGFKVSIQGPEGSSDTPYYGASVAGSSAEEGNGEEVVIVTSEGASAAEEPGWSAVGPYSSSKAARSKGKRSSGQSLSVESWVERFSGTAVQQALQKGVPAGVALAAGIAALQEGKNISTWDAFMKEVILPLARIKENAPTEDLRSYYKYSANSYRWVEGLSRNTHYSATVLQGNIKRYGLSDFDSEVSGRLKGDSALDRKANDVADEVTSAIQSRSASRKSAESRRGSGAEVDHTERWEAEYDEIVGREVAREIARKKLKSGQYISEADMGKLIEETNEETSEVLQRNLSFMGREINPEHPEAESMLDITDPKNAQARQQLYQRKLRERRGTR